MKEKQLAMENMMLAQQTHQQQQLLQQQAQMQMYINTSIAYAQHQFNMQEQKHHMVGGWSAVPVVSTPASQMQRAKTIDKHIKATVLQSDVPQYQRYSRIRSKPRAIPSPAYVFAKSRQMAEANRDEDDDDKPLVYFQEPTPARTSTPTKGQQNADSARRITPPSVKILHPGKRPGQKPHRRSPLAEFNMVATPAPDLPPNNDDLDFIIEMYQDFKMNYDADQVSVVSTGSESKKSVFSWLKGSTHKKSKSSKQLHV